ncbi:Alpha/Beta hydrolase protein [Mycena amicta]|nr:Alpha/Beta hydrolase protein [Mycena amicta]
MLFKAFLFFTLLSCISAKPVVDLGYASYQGVVDESTNITSFLGIRYAAPPTGMRRWKVPAAPEIVSGVQLADTNPPPCYQGTLGASPVNSLSARDGASPSEDCLFLNVFTPNLNPHNLLPTIIWIHGGGYILGSAQDYNGAQLAQEADGKVVVVQAREGFLAGQQVNDDGVANAGLLDQELALRWVNTLIHKFGSGQELTPRSGDPSRVTLWGQSAGAGSAMQHMVANGGNTTPKLFAAAITSSTFLPPQYPSTHRIPQCPDQANLDCLRSVDGAILAAINLNMTARGFQGTTTFVPVVDGIFITQSPTNAFLQGRINGQIALLAISNVNEGFIFVNQSVEYDVQEYVQQLFPTLEKEEIAAVAATYSSLSSPLEQVTGSGCSLMSLSAIYSCPTFIVLDAFSELSYKGTYAIPPANHGDDVPYYFPDFSEFPVSAPFNNTSFALAFQQAFFAFAVNHDPNNKLVGTITPEWPVWFANQEMVFNRTESGEAAIASGTTSQELLKRCQ